MLAPPEVMFEESLSRWKLSTDSKFDLLVISASRVCTLGALITSWFLRESPPSRTVEVVFYVLFILTIITVLTSLQSGSKPKNKLEVFSSHFMLIGQTMISALILTISCIDTDPCKLDNPPPSAPIILQCMSCMGSELTRSDWSSVSRSIHIKYTRTGITMFMCLLGFESGESRIIYSLIPLQVYMVSFPNLSQAEKITGYMCLSCYLLLCLIKMLDVARKQFLNSRTKKKLFKNVPAEKIPFEKAESQGCLKAAPIEQAKSKEKTETVLENVNSEQSAGPNRYRSILIKKTQFQQTEKTSRSKTLRIAEEPSTFSKLSENVEKQEQCWHRESSGPWSPQ